MRPALRIVAVAAVLAAFLSPTSAQAASLFKRDSGGVEIEVHVVKRKIVYLRLVFPISCDPGIPRGEAVIAEELRTIPINRSSGAFHYSEVGGDKDRFRAAFHGTIMNGVIDAQYEYAWTGDYVNGCWSGERMAEPGTPPRGSPVALWVNRHKGLRFYSQNPIGRLTPSGYGAWDRKPHIYMWIEEGKVYGLTVRLGETCWNANPPEGAPSVWRSYQAWLRLKRPLQVDPETRRFGYRQVRGSHGVRLVWRLSALVDRRVVRGQVSYIEDYQPDVYCRTGGRDGPEVRFEARRG